MGQPVAETPAHCQARGVFIHLPNSVLADYRILLAIAGKQAFSDGDDNCNVWMKNAGVFLIVMSMIGGVYIIYEMYLMVKPKAYYPVARGLINPSI